MFDVLRLENLTLEGSKEAIIEPIKKHQSKLGFSDTSIDLIAKTSSGYPYFIQFICKETFDSFIAQIKQGAEPSVPLTEIVAKLDIEFFEPKWSLATDRERDLLSVIATLPNCHDEFTIKEIMDQEKKYPLDKLIGDSHINQLLTKLSKKGLVFRTPRHGKYTLGVPMLGKYIQRQMPRTSP
jgi:hypothetical protein